MNRPSDLDARLTAWLEEGPTSGPDEVLSKTFARARSTRQDRVWLHRLTHPTRFQPMNAMLKIARVVAIALVLADRGRSTPTSVRYAATQPVAHAESIAHPVLPLVDGNLEAGTAYVIDYGAAFPAYPRIVFTAPAAGWLSYNDGNVGKDDHNPLMTPWTATNLMNDPCRSLTGGEVRSACRTDHRRSGNGARPAGCRYCVGPDRRDRGRLPGQAHRAVIARRARHRHLRGPGKGS